LPALQGAFKQSFELMQNKSVIHPNVASLLPCNREKNR
jgi:hypothetical protein